MPRNYTPAEDAERKARLRESERERRQRAVASARGSLAIEGLEVDPETQALVDRYIEGELSIDELMPAIFALDATSGDAG